jgi:hypothetical protein
MQGMKNAMMSSMKPARHLLLSGALLTLLALPAVYGHAQSIGASEMRGMSAADFERHIDQEGPQAFVQRLLKDVDPHSPEEPNFDVVLEHVAEGSNAWLKAAARIAPYTDATFSQGLRVAIADALVANPTGVLKLIGTEDHFDQACGYPFINQTDTYMLRHRREALAALARVHQPALLPKVESCRKQLMDVPRTQARDDSSTAPSARN